jgi:hypothetical protein
VTDLDRDNRVPKPGETQGNSGERADKAAERLENEPGTDKEQHQEDLIDEAVEETFPASDPISPKHIT